MCQVSETTTQKPVGLLQSLRIPTTRWDCLSVDCIAGLPKTSRKNDAIVVVVDRLYQMAYFIPTTTKASAQDVAALFAREVARLHTIPTSIVSDRDPKFFFQF